MEWVSENGSIECPNCKSKLTACDYATDNIGIDGGYNFMCTSCGLCVFCEQLRWTVTKSYLNNEIIGKNVEDLKPITEVDHDVIHENQEIIPNNTVLDFY